MQVTNSPITSNGAHSHDRLLTVRDVAERLRISRPHLYRQINSGKITALKLGGKTVFRENEVERFLTDLPAIGKAS